jgi:uncharacterized protein YegL
MTFSYRLFFLFLFSCTAFALAQPVLDFKRIEVNYPRINLSFKVTCGGTFRTDMGPQQFEVRENGILVKNATLWCPPGEECCVSATLVLDRSGSMAGLPITRVKAGAIAYVDQMNPDGQPCDETGLVSFNNTVTVNLSMTTDKLALRNAINSLTATGMTALWDASATGITQLAMSAKNRCRAVIVLTDGGDNNSQTYRTVQQVITLAIANKVKVYTIGYGVPLGSRAESDLQALANMTGGTYYYSAAGTDLANIFSSIKMTVKEAYKECTLSYETDCPDGTLRTVELFLKNYCGGSVSQVKTYQAPLDRSKFQTVSLRLGTAMVTATKDVIVPVILDTPVKGIFSKGSFTVVYDRSAVQIVKVTTTGALLDGTPVTMQDIGSGHTIYLQDHTEIDGKGVMMFLHFKTADIVAQMNVQLWLYNWYMEAYCLIPTMQNGFITLTPRAPELACTSHAPDRLIWNDSRKEYEPNPFTTGITITNTGTREARNTRVRIAITTRTGTRLSAGIRAASAGIFHLAERTENDPVGLAHHQAGKCRHDARLLYGAIR